MIEKFTTKVSINTQGEAIRFAKALVEVSDDFAIGFAEWLTYNRENNYTKSVKELLEIYKKTL